MLTMCYLKLNRNLRNSGYKNSKGTTVVNFCKGSGNVIFRDCNPQICVFLRN
jgi:hypothetical protein